MSVDAGLVVAMATGRLVSKVLLVIGGRVRLPVGDTDDELLLETGAAVLATAAVIGQAGSILLMVTSMEKSVLLEK